MQVLSYELRMAGLGDDWQQPGRRYLDEPLAPQIEVERLVQHWQQAYLDAEFLDTNNPKAAMTRITRLLTRAQLDQTEVNILRGMLSSVQRWVTRAKPKD